MLKLLRTALVAALLPAGAAHAAAYTGLYVFGDSLSDSGRAYQLANTAPAGTFSGEQWMPSAVGYAQRFSNGPTAAEALAAALGTTATPFGTAGGTNYAVGGARSGALNFNWLANRPAGIQSTPALANTGVNQQVGTFLAAPLPANVGSSLFLVQGGANDFFLASGAGQLNSLADISALAAGAAQNIATAVAALAAGGARSFLVPDLPLIGATPLFGASSLSSPVANPAGAAAANAYTTVYNLVLDGAIDSLRIAFPAIDIFEFDTVTAFGQVLANPAAFGFDPAYAGTSCLRERLQAAPTQAKLDAWNGCDGYLFWDDVHPTAALHALVGGLYAQVALPIPGTAALLGLGLLGLAAGARRAGRRASRAA